MPWTGLSKKGHSDDSSYERYISWIPERSKVQVSLLQDEHNARQQHW
jgi:hypothetical protein